MSVWYPLENRLDQIHEANKKLKDFGFNIVEAELTDKADDVTTTMDQSTSGLIKATLEKLKT